MINPLSSHYQPVQSIRIPLARMKVKEVKAVDYATFALLAAWDNSITATVQRYAAIAGDGAEGYQWPGIPITCKMDQNW
jgi:hypothetical protein